MPAVASGELGGVQVKRHILDQEAASLALMARRIGRRLKYWLRAMPNEMVCLRPGPDRDEYGKPIMVPMAGPDGVPLLEPYLPSEDFRENFRWYSTAVLGLLKEQRERAKLAGKVGGPPLSDEEYELELQLVQREALAEVSTEDLERMLAERRAMDVPPDDRPMIDVGDTESRKRDL